MKEACKAWVKNMMASPTAGGLKMVGTAGSIDVMYSMGDVPTKNFTTNAFPNHEKLVGIRMNPLFECKPEPCYRCPIGHCHSVKIKEGEL